jgi:hypothetical protein
MSRGNDPGRSEAGCMQSKTKSSDIFPENAPASRLSSQTLLLLTSSFVRSLRGLRTLVSLRLAIGGSNGQMVICHSYLRVFRASCARNRYCPSSSSLLSTSAAFSSISRSITSVIPQSKWNARRSTLRFVEMDTRQAKRSYFPPNPSRLLR